MACLAPRDSASLFFFEMPVPPIFPPSVPHSCTNHSRISWRCPNPFLPRVNVYSRPPAACPPLFFFFPPSATHPQTNTFFWRPWYVFLSCHSLFLSSSQTSLTLPPTEEYVNDFYGQPFPGTYSRLAFFSPPCPVFPHSFFHRA